MTDEARRQAEEIVSMVIDCMNAVPLAPPGVKWDWGDIVVEKRRRAAEKVADAMAQAIQEERERWEKAVIYTMNNGAVTGCYICGTRWVTGQLPLHELVVCPMAEALRRAPAGDA